MLQYLTPEQMRCLQLADVIEKDLLPNHTFAMDVFLDKVYSSNQCCTIGCIAGMTCLMYEKDWLYSIESDDDRSIKISNKAAELLGLNKEQQSKLFYPTSYENATKEHAATTLRRFVETGVVVWCYEK